MGYSAQKARLAGDRFPTEVYLKAPLTAAVVTVWRVGPQRFRARAGWLSLAVTAE